MQSLDNLSIIILASGSSRRLALLKQINITPDEVLSPDIDETPKKGEKPKTLAERLSEAKAKAIYQQKKGNFILAADTVVSCGQKILEKPQNSQIATKFLQKLAGRRHQVYGAITLITPDGRTLRRTCKTIVQFKPLSNMEIERYIALGEWEGKAGGYAIQGVAGSFVKYISGSYSNVVGLSLYDTMHLLKSGGYIF